jgi:hypothetical protein
VLVVDAFAHSDNTVLYHEKVSPSTAVLGRDHANDSGSSVGRSWSVVARTRGWPNRDLANHFADYAGILAKHLGVVVVLCDRQRVSAGRRAGTEDGPDSTVQLAKTGEYNHHGLPVAGRPSITS